MAPQPKASVLGVRLSESELRLMQRAADYKDMRLSTAAREVLVRWARRILANGEKP